MKMSPEYTRAQANMQPGAITKDGFLGEDTRLLVDIIAHDEELLKQCEVDIDTAVEKMQYLLEKGMEGLGEPITVDDTWLVKIDEARGKLPCPFEDGLFRKRNVQVEHKASGEKISFSELSLHLLQAHHFLQGKGSFFRLEPEILKKVLMI